MKLITRWDFPDQSEDSLHHTLSEAITQIQDMQKKVKITLKKNYIQDILMQCKGAQNVSQRIFLVVCDSQNLISLANQHSKVKPPVIRRKPQPKPDQPKQPPPAQAGEKATNQAIVAEKAAKDLDSSDAETVRVATASVSQTPQQVKKKNQQPMQKRQQGYESENEKSIDTQSTSIMTSSR